MVINGNYLLMFLSDFWPAFSALQNNDQFFFMQDGAPQDWSTTVRDWLNEKLPNRWIGRGADTDLNIKWPPRSLDLTLSGFFLWGYIKSKVYDSQP